MIETTAAEPEVSRNANGAKPKAPSRRKIWRLAAALTATALCALLYLVGPGSIELIARPPVNGVRAGQPAPGWARPCFRAQRSFHYPELAFCARVNGRVLASGTVGGEPHLLVSGGFHLTLVELPSGSRIPPRGSRITAVGPLLRGEYGLRELIAQATSRQ